MVEIVRNTIPPAQERPKNPQDFSYSAIFTPRMIVPEIHVSMTFYFEGKIPNNFIGSTYQIFDGESNKCEAKSFFNAYLKAWDEYKNRDKKYRKFVKESLKNKWKELNGKELTGKTLIFD